MRGHSLRVVTWLLASVVLGCAPAPSASPSITPPPLPAEFVPWPDLVWRTAELPSRPASATGERVGAVTASDDGFVAVGYRETEDVRDGMVWSSTDGETWMAVDDALFKRVELVDVAAAPSGFVAVGVESPDGDHPSTVVYGSDDGRSWRRLPPLPATGDTYPEAMAGGAQGVLVVGSDAAGATAVWRSDDARSFQRVTLTAPAADGVVDPHAVDDGFIAVGIKDGAPVLLRSADGAAWTASVIDPATDVDASNVVRGRWGIVVHGTATPDCGDPDSCPVEDVGWWSADGTAFGRLPDGDSPVLNGVSLLVPAEEHGLLAIDGANAWSSPDGWAWRSLPEPGDGSVDLDDAVVQGGLIVAVGTEFSDQDDTYVGRIVVAH
jgi:hypothetical protein